MSKNCVRCDGPSCIDVCHCGFPHHICQCLDQPWYHICRQCFIILYINCPICPSHSDKFEQLEWWFIMLAN